MTGLRRAAAIIGILGASVACSGSGADPEDAGASADAGSEGFCEPPLKLCAGSCVSVENNPSHCGACFGACEPSSFCDLGECAAICSAGLTECGAACADLQTDRAHCGECDRACPGDRMCVGGSCVCAPGAEDCGGACVDVTTNLRHCGVCNTACQADEVCSGAACVCRTATRETNCNDGVDDDCDDLIDCMDPDCEGVTRRCMGACGVGTEACSSGTWGTCEGGNGEAEICGDGVDQDCDGEDERAPDGWEPNDDCAQCRLISPNPDPNLMIEARFDSVDDPVDCYRFIAEDNNAYREHIRVRLENVPIGHDYDIYLYEDQAGCEARSAIAVSAAFGDDDEFIEWGESFGSSESGTYFVRVVRFAGHSCTDDYLLTIDGLR